MGENVFNIPKNILNYLKYYFKYLNQILFDKISRNKLVHIRR